MSLSSDCCVFTIVSRNYLHFAINLMHSVAEHMPSARRVVAICDSIDGIPVDELQFEVIGIESLPIPHLDRLLYQYTILELNTAIKPFVFSHLLDSGKLDKVIYFDPDIQLFSSGDTLLSSLDQASIVLTPHLTDFIHDDGHPSEVSIMQSGTYNLGFLALRRSFSAQKLLTWWQQRLSRLCVVDIPNGLFTDQKWMDIVPGIFADSLIARSPGWNVAYWNLMHRTIEKNEKEKYLVNGEPLFFFHYSGYDSKNPSISKHQDRFKLSNLNAATQTLFKLYSQRIDASGRDKFAAFPYAFAQMSSGLPLPDCARRFLRENLDWDQQIPDLRTAAGEQFVIDLLNEKVDAGRPLITRLAWSVYCTREDLQQAFPDIQSMHRQAYVDWYLENAEQQIGIPGILVDSMRPDKMSVSSNSSPGTNTGADAENVAGDHNLPWSASFGKMLYKAAWASRHLVRPFLSKSLRHRIRMRLLQRAYQGELAQRPVAMAKAQSTDSPAGINVIGYLRSESGVGESARSMLRALQAVAVPHSSINFDVGNISRQSEDPQTNSLERLHYAINLFHINADQAWVAYDSLGDQFFAGRRCIGFWAWELPEFPDEWLSSFQHFDEIWVPSTFCQRAVAAKSPVPVVCIPHTIEIPASLNPDKARFGLNPEAFSFLAMADMLSVPERKNPMGAVEAFIAAFAGDDSAELLVKLSNPEIRPEITAQLRAYAEKHQNIHLLEGYLGREDVNRLIDSVECFVSLHRSEGFGLVIAEAMARGKVVVATGWSGNMDFMNTGNSMLVDYRLTELDQDYGPYRKGQRWADPDIRDAAVKMRQIKEHPELAAEIGQQARLTCQTLLAEAVVGYQVRQRLQAILRR
ncbi:MAG: glycosyltransferase [Pseudomonadales bacterium]|nr:glycosyltransferase [Pseudomonadales bacterium]